MPTCAQLNTMIGELAAKLGQPAKTTRRSRKPELVAERDRLQVALSEMAVNEERKLTAEWDDCLDDMVADLAPQEKSTAPDISETMPAAEAKVDPPAAEVKVDPLVPKHRRPRANKTKFIRLTETVDVNKLSYIVDNFAKFKSQLRWRERYDVINPAVIITKYLKKSKKGRIAVTYKQNGGRGRFCAMGSLSLQAIPREIRHTISRDYYIDLDMVNAHPVILQWLCRSNGFACPHLSEYISGREGLLKQIIIDGEIADRGKAKQIYLALTNGGKADFKKVSKPSKHLVGYKDEMIQLHSLFAKQDPKAFEKVRKRRVKAGKDYNHEASYMNTLLCDMENDLLMEIWQYMGQPNNAVLCFDGIMLADRKFLDHDIPYDVEGCMVALKERYGIDMKLKIKTMDEHLDLSNCNIETYVEPGKMKVLNDGEVQELMDGMYGHEEVETQTSKKSKLAIKCLVSWMTDEDVSDYFMAVYGPDFVNYDEHLYHWNGHYWPKDDSCTDLQKAIAKKVSADLLGVMGPLYAYRDSCRGGPADTAKGPAPLQLPIRSKLEVKINKRMRNWGARQGIVKAIMCNLKIGVAKDIWDEDPDLLGFNNGTLDLRTGVFRNGRRSDYISMTTGYDYVQPTAAEVDDFHEDFICKVLPIPDQRECTMRLLATSLRGQTVENIAIMTGNGRNGKDTMITILLKRALGDYAYIGPKSAIVGQVKSGGLNQEVANMHKKRVVIYNEPKKTDTLNCQSLCELSGGDEINSRGLYSKRTATKLKALHVILCNGIPAMDYVISAMVKRLIICQFPAQFLNAYARAQIPPDTPFVHDVNTTFKQAQWVNGKLSCFIAVLMRYYKKFRDDGYVIRDVPQAMRDFGKKYMSESDNFYQWFAEVYEKTDSADDFVKVKDVYAAFKGSELYSNMTKKERRGMNRNGLVEALKENMQLRNFYRKDNACLDRRNVIERMVMWKPKPDDWDNGPRVGFGMDAGMALDALGLN